LEDGHTEMTVSRQSKLLIIDEINYTRLALDLVLSSFGYKVATAHNSGEAMQSICTELPDLILLSLRASDATGVSTRKALKDYFRLRLDIAQGAEPPIIILSAFRDTKQIREIETLGVSKVLFKPINIQELLDGVESVIANKKKVMPRSRKKIMIFDSETRSQQFIESFLVHDVYDIEAADSEGELLARLKHRKFDLCIIDLVSLESGAVDVLQRIKAIAEDIPIITIANSADWISQDELKQLGMQMHFIKPLNVDVFRTEVDTLLSVSASQQKETTEHADDADDEQ
jgi:CheY-like chemotaxis protein